MAEHILLTFLSDVKVFGGKVSEVEYDNIKGSEKTHTTNESAVRYILKNEDEISRIFILASKKIRGVDNDGKIDEKKLILIENNPTVTHLDYFTNRMKKFLPNVEYTTYNFDEDLTGDENLKSVAAIAKMIQEYAENREIVLHVDLTGGMRHINMLMLDVIRLLEYSGIKIGRLIYSNYKGKDKKSTVEEVKNIYDLFQLISGVEEFINFGSVEALKKYYAGIEQSEQPKKLTGAMENFAEAIKLCRYGQFKAAIENLHDAINDFETNIENVQDILMERLIGKIREKYSMLIATRGQDDLKIIRWCVEHGYLQQALTLYTERVPEYIYKKFVVLTDKYREAVDKILKKDNRNEGFYVLNNYLEDDKDFKTARADFIKQVDALNEGRGDYFSSIKKFAVPAVQADIFNYDNLKGKIVIEKNLSAGIKAPNENQLRLQLETLSKIWNNPALLSDLESVELLPIKEFIKSIKSLQVTKPSKRFNVLFKNLPTNDLNGKLASYEGDTRIFRLDYMLRKNIFRLAMDKEKFFSVMEKYFTLKDERNHSNHARLDIGEFETAKDLEDFIKSGLDEIETIEKIEISEITEIEEPKEIISVEKIFVNHTNHTSENWSAEQKAAAEKLGRIVDLPFPEVSPNFSAKQVKDMVIKNLQAILEFAPVAVLCQGEFNYTVAMVEELKKNKIPVMAATSERVVSEITEPDGSTKKVSTFKFVNFRQY